MRSVARLLCAIGCVVLAGGATRASIADAVLGRGDDAARSGDLAVAEAYYERAQAIGGDRIETLERFALFALLAPRGTPLDAALRSANGFVSHYSASAPGRFDRGLIEWRLRRYASAAIDFRIAASIGGDPRARMFAAAAGRRAGGGSVR